MKSEKVKKMNDMPEKIFGIAGTGLHKHHSNAKKLVQTQEEHSS